MSAPVAIDWRAAHAWPALRPFASIRAGSIVQDEASGAILVIRADGGAEEVNALPRRRSIAADPSATKGGRR